MRQGEDHWMDYQEPTREEWIALYEASVRFRDLAPWQWINDSTLFAVRNPERDEAAYCCVMGKLDDVFGLVAYRGDRGFSVFQRLKDQEDQPGNPELAVSQDCLLAMFCDRDLLAEEEVELIDSLGLKFEGGNAWPQFQSYVPDFVPWALDTKEARFLTVILEQACEVAERARKDAEMLAPGQGDFFARIQADGNWKDTRIKPGHWVPPAPPEVSFDEIRMERLGQFPRRSQAVLELDILAIPAPLGDRGRPYFPRSLMIVDQESGQIVCSTMMVPWNYHKKAAGELLRLFEAMKVRPETVWFRKQAVSDFFEPILKQLGVGAALVDALPALQKQEESMFAYLHDEVM